MFIVKLVVNEKCDDDEKDVDIDENESDFCDDVYVDEVFVLSFFFLCSFPSLEHRQACIEIHEKDMEHSFAVQRCNHFIHIDCVICCMLFLLIDFEEIFCLVAGARVSRVESV